MNEELPVKRQAPPLYANGGVTVSTLSDVHAAPASYIPESLLRGSLEIICGLLHIVFDVIFIKFRCGTGERTVEIFSCSLVHEDATCLDTGRWFHFAKLELRTDFRYGVSRRIDG